MGTVFRARDPRIAGRLVAIKLLKEDIDNPELRARFKQEADAAGALDHDNIVRILDAGDHEGQPFIAMDYIDGETLADKIKHKVNLPLLTKLQFMEELCDGLAYAHSFRIVHRDIKPANLIVERRRSRLKILDFGIAKLSDSAMTKAGVFIGTINYMSPEQISGQTDLDHRSDIFSVGSVFYELLTYKRAFPGALHDGVMGRVMHQEPQSLVELVPTIDPEIERIVRQALRKNPADRYQDLSTMQREVARVRKRLEKAGAEETRPGISDETLPGSAEPVSPPPRRVLDEDRVRQVRERQIRENLNVAERAMEGGQPAAVIDACERIFAVDREHARALELHARAQATLEQQQVRVWLDEARGALARGELSAADQRMRLALDRMPDAPEVQAVAQAVAQARRTMLANRAVDRARMRLAGGELESAIRSVDEALGQVADYAPALQLRKQVEAAQREAEVRLASEREVAEARKQFAEGNHRAALARLEAFEPKHALVVEALEALRAEHDRLRRLEEEAALRRKLDALLAAAETSIVKRDADGALAKTKAAFELAPRDERTLDLERQARELAEQLAAERRAKEEAEKAERARVALEQRARRTAAEARQLFANGQHNEALQLLKSFTPHRDEIARTLAELGDELTAIQRKHAEKAARERRQLFDARIASAHSALVEGRFADARADVRAAAIADPHGPGVAELLGRIEVAESQAAERARQEAAERALKERREQEAFDQRARNVVAAANREFEAGEHRAAIARLEGFAPPHDEVSRALATLRATHADIERQRQESAELVAGHVARAEMRLGRQEFRAARKDIEAALRIESEAPDALALLARIEREEAQAAEEARQARERERIARLVVDKLKKARRARSPEKARQLVLEALEVDGSNVEASALLEQYDRDIAEAERARELQLREQPRDAHETPSVDTVVLSPVSPGPTTGLDVEHGRLVEPPSTDGFLGSLSPELRQRALVGVAAVLLVLVAVIGLWRSARTTTDIDSPIATDTPIAEPSPPAIPIVPVTIDAIPWARFKVLPAASGVDVPAGELLTPITLQLPAGDYTLELENGNLTKPRSERITVAADRANTVLITMPGFDVEQTLADILSEGTR